jgi:endonuclease/exonuclease/phosphatase family metal-dependent hydrolase
MRPANQVYFNPFRFDLKGESVLVFIHKSMKLISLNTAGAAQGELFFDFIKAHSENTDVFCLQEVFSSSSQAPEKQGQYLLKQFHKISEILPNFTPFFDAKSRDLTDEGPTPVEWGVLLGSCMFVKKSLKVELQENYPIVDATQAGSPLVEGWVRAQHIKLKVQNRLLNIINFHGVSRPGTKLDTPARLLQSQKLLELIKNFGRPMVLCGDFNLYPNTQSIKILEEHLVNLIDKYKITNTRNEISWANYPDKQHFADYAFVSNNIKVKNFEVPYNLVSDHLPMILEFEL